MLNQKQKHLEAIRRRIPAKCSQRQEPLLASVFSFLIHNSPSQTRMMMQLSQTAPSDSTSPDGVTFELALKLSLTQLDLTIETAIKDGY